MTKVKKRLTSLGLDDLPDDQSSDLATQQHVTRTLDQVASTLPDRLLKSFYAEAKVEEKVLLLELAGRHPVEVNKIALERFTELATRLTLENG